VRNRPVLYVVAGGGASEGGGGSSSGSDAAHHKSVLNTNFSLLLLFLSFPSFFVVRACGRYAQNHRSVFFSYNVS
jgi:hypothetical protein